MIFGQKIEVNRQLGAAIARYRKKHTIKMIPPETFKIVKLTKPRGKQMYCQPFGCYHIPNHGHY